MRSFRYVQVNISIVNFIFVTLNYLNITSNRSQNLDTPNYAHLLLSKMRIRELLKFYFILSKLGGHIHTHIHDNQSHLFRWSHALICFLFETWSFSSLFYPARAAEGPWMTAYSIGYLYKQSPHLYRSAAFSRPKHCSLPDNPSILGKCDIDGK